MPMGTVLLGTFDGCLGGNIRKGKGFMYTKIDGIKCKKGHSIPFGASLTKDGGINFSINSRDATSCTLELYKDDGPAFATIKLPDNFKKGSNYAITVYDLDPKEISYTYRFDGEKDPSKGLMFNPSISLLDPYAKIISGREVWHKDIDRPMRGRILTEEFPWKDKIKADLDFKDLVIYELHVRGFTNDPYSMTKAKGTYKGVIDMIPHLKELGINCVELLPMFEFDDLEDNGSYEGEKLYNYWGYNTVGFFAPKVAYAETDDPAEAVTEFKTMVQQLHKNGIRVILDVVFNHTAEYTPPLGVTYNFRGIDNRTYYILDENGKDKDLTACGNTFKCNEPLVLGYILDCLRYWASEYHIDGFRFDEGAILSRSMTGEVMDNPPVLEAISTDPVLSSVWLIAEAIDAAGAYEVGSFPADPRWGEWNDKFAHCVRKFIRGEAGAGPELLLRLQGSPDIYNDSYPHRCVNYVTCHDGFTMNDLVSYDERHNKENGMNGRDGIAENYSWNCGYEGETMDDEIDFLRSRQVKNIFALLMLSRGTPMMLAGDEIRNTQWGNNNVFCQDNVVSWINWDRREEYGDVQDFFKAMISLRNAHPVIRVFGEKISENSSGYPELSFHGAEPWKLDTNAPFSTFGFMYAETVEDHDADEDCFIYCGVNAHWEQQSLRLPIVPAGFNWSIYATSSRDFEPTVSPDGVMELEARSVVILIAAKD